MGRQLVHSAQRQAVAQHQAGTAAKTQQQRHPLPQRPASAPPRPQSPTQVKTHSPTPQPRQQQLQQQQQQPQRTISINTRPTVHTYLPDTSFVKDAWLLDLSRVPQWMAPHLPKQYVLPTHFSRNQAPLSPKGNRIMSPCLPSPKMPLSSSPTMNISTPLSPSLRAVSPKSPTMQFGDDAFLWNGWSQWSGKPLWTNHDAEQSHSPSPSAKALSRMPTTLGASAQSAAGQKSQQQSKASLKRPAVGHV